MAYILLNLITCTQVQQESISLIIVSGVHINFSLSPSLPVNTNYVAVVSFSSRLTGVQDTATSAT